MLIWPANATFKTTLSQSQKPKFLMAGLKNFQQTSPKRITYNDLRLYRFSQRSRSPIPPKLQSVNGKLVSIAGYMIPLSTAKEISEFMLIQYPFFGCCYSIPPEPNETVLVSMPKGKSVDYLEKPIRVTGRFIVNDTKIDGFTVSLYRIESAKIAITSANDKDIKQHTGRGWIPGN
jgi:hypothetical protein